MGKIKIINNLAEAFAKFERFAEKHPELEHNVNVGIAPPSIDHGRLLTHQRRELFSRLHAEITGTGGSIVWQVPNSSLLSPRRIDRELEALNLVSSNRSRGQISAEIADEIFRLMRNWRDGGLTVPIHEIGYPVVVGEPGHVGGWTIRLVLS